jgi:hypothetical protein
VPVLWKSYGTLSDLPKPDAINAPQQFYENNMHSIFDAIQAIHIQLSMSGVILVFDTHKPT